MAKRSEDGSEMASPSTKLFEAICVSYLKFFIIFGILPVAFAKRKPELAENKQNMFFFMEAYF